MRGRSSEHGKGRGSVDETRIRQLRRKAANLRIAGLNMVREARSGHIGGAFSLSEIMAVLYFDKMNIRPEQPGWADRDRLVLSKGHATVALYPALALRGFFPVERLSTFRKIDGELSGHADMKHVPGVDMSTGSLGQGFSAAVGIALAGKQQKKGYTTYAILGDGELQEGQIWEACMFAAHYRLDNLIAIVDHNKVQLDGRVEEVMSLGDLAAKFSAFGFHVIELDGHDVAQIASAIDEAKSIAGRPSALLANTVKGKGVRFMEDTCEWHGKTPDERQFEQAFEQLHAARKALEG